MSEAPVCAAAIQEETPVEELQRQAEILLHRAERLARQEAPHTTQDDMLLLMFELSTEQFALELNEVRAVVPIQRYTPMPGTPAELLGVTHVRGELLPLLDLGRVFQLASQENGPGHAVVCDRGIRLALRVDRVHDVVRVSRHTLQSPDHAGSLSGLLAGVLPDGTALIRLDALLSHPALGNAARS